MVADDVRGVDAAGFAHFVVMTNLLIVTTLYPNAVQFRHGIFVEARLRRLLATGQFTATVIAPVPWFPSASARFGQYAKYAKVPRMEIRQGIEVYHPRYLVIPKVGMVLTPLLLAWSVWREAWRLRRKGKRWDLLDAHYYYPDGVSAALVARLLRLPLTITARGSDINVLPAFKLPRKMIGWAAMRTRTSIAVSDALRRAMINLGHDADKIEVWRNGVDLDLFRPIPKSKARERLGLTRTTLCSVGNLIELKGHDLVIRALEHMPDCDLIIVGDGELRDSLRQLTESLGLASRVRFLGTVRQEELVEIYSAADALVLASSREGMPNVVLEAMACDTLVVATKVGGIPEVLQGEDAGVLIETHDASHIADAVSNLFEHYPLPGVTRKCAGRFSWDSTIEGLSATLHRAAQEVA